MKEWGQQLMSGQVKQRHGQTQLLLRKNERHEGEHRTATACPGYQVVVTQVVNVLQD